MRNIITNALGFKRTEKKTEVLIIEEAPTPELPEYMATPIQRTYRKLAANPKKTAIWMFVIVLVNFLIFEALMFLAKKEEKINNTYKALLDSAKTQSIKNVGAGTENIPYTISNFREIKAIKDSMEILLQNKDNLTDDDKQRFLSLMKRLQRLETQTP
jgi:hypothetical protein